MWSSNVDYDIASSNIFLKINRIMHTLMDFKMKLIFIKFDNIYEF